MHHLLGNASAPCDTSFKARRIEISLLTYLLTYLLTMQYRQAMCTSMMCTVSDS